MNKEFKKGEHVYVHSDDRRNNSYEAIVTNVGRKYITCNRIWSDGDVCAREDKFDIVSLRRVDYGEFYLYHNKEEYKNENLRKTLAMDMKNTYGNCSLEELLLFKEIHDIGIEKWKEEHYR